MARPVTKVLLAALLALAALPASGAAAATFTVNNTGDATGSCPTPTTCSLRQAITSADATSGNDTITFNLPAPSTITLTKGPLGVAPTTPADALTIQGPGAKALIVKQTTANSPVINFTGGTNSVSGLELTGGAAGPFQGGGFSNQTPLTIDSVLITGNTANAGGAGASGGLVNFGSLTMRNSTVAGNTVTNSGMAGSGGGMVLVGGSPGASATLVDTTVTQNHVTGSGGGDGGVALLVGANVLMDNVTLAGNTAQGGAGGIFAFAGSLSLTNSLLAANTGSGGADCGGTPVIVSHGYNLLGSNAGCTFTPAVGDQVGTTAAPINPQLGPLADNGGPTPTLALLPGSPAINAANPAATSDAAPSGSGAIPCRTTDQRSVSRPQGTVCDIGAFELEVPHSAAPTISGTAAVGSQLTCTPGSSTPAATSVSYQWTKDGASVPGATSQTFTPQAPGSYTCVVTGSDAAGAGNAAASAAVTVVAGQSTAITPTTAPTTTTTAAAAPSISAPQLTQLTAGRRCARSVHLLSSPLSGTSGLSFSFRLNVSASVELIVMRRNGSRGRTSCPGSHGRSQDTYSPVGSLVGPGSAGQNSSQIATAAAWMRHVRLRRSSHVDVHLPQGRGVQHISLAQLAGAAGLVPGTYVLFARATNAAGRSSTSSVKFWVLR